MIYDFETFPILETERLILRRLISDDVPDWLAILENEDVKRCLVDFPVNPSPADIQEIVDWADMIFEHKTGIRWAITRKPDDTMIGTCGFHVYNSDNHYAEIGYELNRDYWRQGIMREAVTAVLDFCFDNLDLHRVEADVTEGNEASAGLLKNLGFVQEGIWRERVFAQGQYYSLWQFGLLRDEYKS